MNDDRYGSDVLGGSGSTHHRPTRTSRPQPAETGLVVEEVTTGWVGAVVRVEKSGGQHVVVLEDRRGRTRTFPLGRGFWLDGEPVALTAPVRAPAPARPTRTASGSVAVHDARARVARGSRIWVEGKHDAELVEKVWGDDLRLEGVVVELLDGVDNLQDALRDFAPGPGRRVGVLVDHLVAGSKESRIAAEAVRGDARRIGARARSPVRRRVAGRPARAHRARRVARRSSAAPSGSTASCASSAGRPTSRRTSPARGSGSCARCAATPTSSPACWAASRSSSTSSPRDGARPPTTGRPGTVHVRRSGGDRVPEQPLEQERRRQEHDGHGDEEADAAEDRPGDEMAMLSR